MEIRKAFIAVAAGVALAIGGAVPAIAASASINPNTQTTSAGNAYWSGGWSGGSIGRFYPSNGGQFGWYSVPSSYSTSWNFNTCPSTYTLTQELDVMSGTTLVAAATAKTTVKHTSPC